MASPGAVAKKNERQIAKIWAAVQEQTGVLIKLIENIDQLRAEVAELKSVMTPAQAIPPAAARKPKK